MVVTAEFALTEFYRATIRARAGIAHGLTGRELQGTFIISSRPTISTAEWMHEMGYELPEEAPPVIDLETANEEALKKTAQWAAQQGGWAASLEKPEPK